jgi:polysaccharide pyruvyl transferase WcaK-like protein
LFRHTRSFVKNHIQTTGLISQKLNQKMLSDYAFEAYIVGSDQVWRPRYSPQLPSFFLDFLADNAGVRKIAYAASFGVSDWEFSEAQTSAFGRLLRLFDAVSVREDSGVALCRQYFGLEATRLPDPSLLLTAEDYSALAAGAERQTSPGELYTYILDRTDDKDRVIGYLAKKHHWQPFTVMPDKNATPAGRRIQAYVFPPVEEWLRAFAAARFVVTDSFHGTVFSILFNKPFITLANQGRGLSRFSSLLKLFQLEDRLVQAADESALDKLDKLNDIDWPKTRRLLQGEREKALRFLTTCLAN